MRISYQNPKTAAPTAYKVEGSLHRQAAREGPWSIIRGAETDPNAIVYRLEPTQTEAALLLLKGDDDVLFFLNQHYKPLVGHTNFSYTLNRVKKELMISLNSLSNSIFSDGFRSQLENRKLQVVAEIAAGLENLSASCPDTMRGAPKSSGRFIV